MTDRAAPDLPFVTDIVKTATARARRIYPAVDAFPGDPGIYEVGSGPTAGTVYERATQDGPLTLRPEWGTATGQGAAIPISTLISWTQGEAYEPLTITRNGDGLVTTATVTWPDGSAGVLTATNYNATVGVYDGFTITHATSGKTITQAAVTRDLNGAVTVKPALTVS